MEQFEYTQAIIELKRTLIAHDGLTLTGLAAGLLIWTNVHSLHSWQVVSASHIYRHRNMVQHRKPCDCFGHYHFDAVTCSLRLVCQHLISVGMKLKNIDTNGDICLKSKSFTFSSVLVAGAKASPIEKVVGTQLRNVLEMINIPHKFHSYFRKLRNPVKLLY